VKNTPPIIISSSRRFIISGFFLKARAIFVREPIATIVLIPDFTFSIIKSTALSL
jgi:hypothetical protein